MSIRSPRRGGADLVSDAEQNWALGGPLDDSDETISIRFFTSADRLREVFEEVRGESWQSWCARNPDASRHVYNGAVMQRPG